MGRTGDPWPSGGERTRSEVREIFAQHAERAGSSATPHGEEQRRRPLPGFLKLPVSLWRILPRGGKIAVGALGLALVIVLALLVPPALDNAGENRDNQRRAAAANRERMRLALVEDQRPRRATLAVPVRVGDVERAVGADYSRRVRAGQLDGPAGATSCRPVVGRQEPGAIVLTCLARPGDSTGVYGDRKLVTGYRFRARVVEATGATAWCKENPRPLHPDQEEFVTVALSRACTG
jgi:hypothetical protein